MDSLELTIPPPVVMLATSLIMWLLSFVFPAFMVTSLHSFTGAVIIGLAGLGISTAGIMGFRHVRTTIDPRAPGDASTLVTSGIYRYTRNPMYLGILLVLLGWGVFLGNVLSLICAFVFVPYISRYQIQPEERLLQGKFGAAFTSYKKTVRRWI